MRVPIQGEGSCEVPHVFLEGLHVITGPKRRNRECVSQIVETVMFNPSSGQNLLENFPYCRLRQMATIRMSKDQTRESPIIPDILRLDTLLILGLFVFLENLHDERCRSDGAGLVIFQRPKLESTAFLARLEKLLFYMDHADFKVHAVPGQPQQFTGTHPGKQRGFEQCFMLMTFQVLHQFR